MGLFTLSPDKARAAADQLSRANLPMPPNPTLATALRTAAHTFLYDNPGTCVTDHYGHTLHRQVLGRQAFLTSWALSSNMNMTTTPSPTADPSLPVTSEFLLRDGSLCQTAAITLMMMADLIGAPDGHLWDLNPTAVQAPIAPTNANTGAYQAPPFHNEVLAATSEALITTTFDPNNSAPHSVLNIQSTPCILAILDAAHRFNVIVHRTNPNNLPATFGLQMPEIDAGGGGTFGVYLLERDGRFILLIGVPSASLATRGPVSFDRNGVVLTTFNLMQINLALTGQPLLSPESSAYLNGTSPSSSRAAIAGVLARGDIDVPYFTPSQRGGQASVSVETHGDRMRNGGKASAEGAGQMSKKLGRVATTMEKRGELGGKASAEGAGQYSKNLDRDAKTMEKRGELSAEGAGKMSKNLDRIALTMEERGHKKRKPRMPLSGAAKVARDQKNLRDREKRKADKAKRWTCKTCQKTGSKGNRMRGMPKHLEESPDCNRGGDFLASFDCP
ncbi:hypothetical protein TrRE_jg3198 [Triparma retinervis]|uniref:Uncharacterized protein n=1 Tax=Triparma retinervis TaxID=2557542 RepID=A0A9W7E440_9STRA|nr:hypothetical protein TrRE_jg3198 [Triparma retinervis]